MRNALVRVGNTHHGSLIPGTVIVVQVEPSDIGALVSFANPEGGFSIGRLVAYTTPGQDLLIGDAREQGK